MRASVIEGKIVLDVPSLCDRVHKLDERKRKGLRSNLENKDKYQFGKRVTRHSSGVTLAVVDDAIVPWFAVEHRITSKVIIACFPGNLRFVCDLEVLEFLDLKECQPMLKFITGKKDTYLRIFGEGKQRVWILSHCREISSQVALQSLTQLQERRVVAVSPFNLCKRSQRFRSTEVDVIELDRLFSGRHLQVFQGQQLLIFVKCVYPCTQFSESSEAVCYVAELNKELIISVCVRASITI